jgi:hypothetical protein
MSKNNKIFSEIVMALNAIAFFTLEEKLGKENDE